MNKIRIVTDSNSGITQEEAKKLGVFVVPMPFLINGEEYYEDINLTQEQFYVHLRGDASVSTSQPSPGARRFRPLPGWYRSNLARYPLSQHPLRLRSDRALQLP